MSSVSNGMEIETAAVEIAEMVNMETVEMNSACNEAATENQPNATPEVGAPNNNILNTFGGDTEFGGGAPVAAPAAKAKEKNLHPSLVEEIKNSQRFFLHAKTLGFIHPRTKEKLLFEIDWPETEKRLITQWKLYV
jgi:hypothetical protein